MLKIILQSYENKLLVPKVNFISIKIILIVIIQNKFIKYQPVDRLQTDVRL